MYVQNQALECLELYFYENRLFFRLVIERAYICTHIKYQHFYLTICKRYEIFKKEKLSRGSKNLHFVRSEPNCSLSKLFSYQKISFPNFPSPES